MAFSVIKYWEVLVSNDSFELKLKFWLKNTNYSEKLIAFLGSP